MRVSVLFSSGKDSSLAALLLEPFFQVELVTINFGISPTHEFAADSASKLGLPHSVLALPPSLVEEAATMLMEDGSPGRAINYLHHQALEAVCSQSDVHVVADGTRRDDRVPLLTPPQVQSLEDRHNIMYVRPLFGYGRSAIDALVRQHLEVVQAQSDTVDKADYEAELRAFIRKQYNEGESIVVRSFPEHIQSHVIDRIYP
ncbi:MAG: alpha hydrolase [ANME-2 cluster archaeon]|jgi:predicted subunit of tRNA(5-methylaminomethyl-2-thiouridylate) methyltransferase|nr:alpha hydrolase [ANME-2 cluster archaeon]